MRQSGAPAAITRNFSVQDPAAPYRLRIENGGAGGQFQAVSSAVVTLNGAVVVGTNEFNQTVRLIEKQIPLAARNELKVEIRSNPGSGFTLTILGELIPITVQIAAPVSGFVVQDDSIDVTGTTSGPVVSVVVNGVQAALGNSSFIARGVPLAEGTNRLVAIASNRAGETVSDSVAGRRDTSPPLVVIETPRDGERLITETVTIAGTVNDIIPGATVNSDDVTVRVNERPAAVNNRTFTFPDLALALGSNTIVAEAVDQAGNVNSASIEITREPDLAGIRILITQGNNQRAPINSALPLPLEVRVVTREGQVLAGRPVEFEVSKGDGLLGAPADHLRRKMLLTGANGNAAVNFSLGSRTGEGFHRVRVTTPGSLTFAEFCATAEPTPPTTLSITLRPPLRSAAGQRMPDPLAVIVTDQGGNPVPGVPVTFRVEFGGGSFGGQESVVVPTNPDGIASAFWTLGPDPGVANNEASATFEGNPGLPATFMVSGIAAGPVGETRVSGVVQDSAGQPIVGAKAVIRGINLEAFTGPDGRFTIPGVSPGEQRVAILGSTANDPARGIFFPHIDFALQVIAGADNELDQIVILPFLDMANAKVVGGDEDVILGMEGVPGFAIKVFAHSAILPDGTRGEILMSSSQVKFDKVPMPPPRGSTAFIVGTLQPGGVFFDPPAQVIYPNIEGLAPGDVADIYAFHHDIGQFVNVGPGTVSEDGSVIASDPGFGLVESGWHCLIRIPGPTSNCANGCSARLEWQTVKPDNSLGPLMTNGPVQLSCLDKDAQKVKVNVQFMPAGGTFDFSNWSSSKPSVTLSDQSTAGSSAKVTLSATTIVEPLAVTSPIYRIAVANQADKTCQAEVGVAVDGFEFIDDANNMIPLAGTGSRLLISKIITDRLIDTAASGTFPRGSVTFDGPATGDSDVFRVQLRGAPAGLSPQPQIKVEVLKPNDTARSSATYTTVEGMINGVPTYRINEQLRLVTNAADDGVGGARNSTRLARLDETLTNDRVRAQVTVAGTTCTNILPVCRPPNEAQSTAIRTGKIHFVTLSGASHNAATTLSWMNDDWSQACIRYQSVGTVDNQATVSNALLIQGSATGAGMLTVTINGNAVSVPAANGDSTQKIAQAVAAAIGGVGGLTAQEFIHNTDYLVLVNRRATTQPTFNALNSTVPGVSFTQPSLTYSDADVTLLEGAVLGLNYKDEDATTIDFFAVGAGGIVGGNRAATGFDSLAGILPGWENTVVNADFRLSPTAGDNTHTPSHELGHSLFDIGNPGHSALTTNLFYGGGVIGEPGINSSKRLTDAQNTEARADSGPGSPGPLLLEPK